MPGLSPTKTQIKSGVRESVRWLVMWAYFDGGAYDEDGRFFFKGEEEAGDAGSVALRFIEAARDVALRAGDDTPRAETLQSDVAAGVGEVWVEINVLVTGLFGDGFSARVYCSRAPLKLGKGFCSTSMAFSHEGIIRDKVSATLS